jgi:hypothetical protein
MVSLICLIIIPDSHPRKSTDTVSEKKERRKRRNKGMKNEKASGPSSETLYAS